MARFIFYDITFTLVVISALSATGDKDEHRVSKNVFSSTNRAIFVAGLEGTGHHLFRLLAESCNNGGRSICHQDKAAMCLLYNNTPHSPHPTSTLFNSFWGHEEYIGKRRR